MRLQGISNTTVALPPIFLRSASKDYAARKKRDTFEIYFPLRKKMTTYKYTFPNEIKDTF